MATFQLNDLSDSEATIEIKSTTGDKVGFHINKIGRIRYEDHLEKKPCRKDKPVLLLMRVIFKIYQVVVAVVLEVIFISVATPQVIHPCAS